MTSQIASRIWESLYAVLPGKIERLLTGYCHYVYRIEHRQGQYILRVSSQENRRYLESALYWNKRLSNLSIPIPKIIRQGVSEGYPYIVYPYIPGRDLGHVYRELNVGEKKHIALRLAEIQNRVSQLPLHRGFGYLCSYEDEAYLPSWKEVILGHLERSRQGIERNRIFDTTVIERIKGLLPLYDDYLESIEPKAFLDDTTTKNVLIYQGQISGIIDIDEVCFGDRVYVLGLTRMALLNMDADDDYIEYWARAWSLDAAQRKVLEFYTLIFCVDFMAEKGHRFNRDEEPDVSQVEIDRLLKIYDRQILLSS